MPDLTQILGMLERDDALELEEHNDTWPSIDDGETVVEVDHNSLFPNTRPQRDGADFDLYGDEWEIPWEDAEAIVGEGAPATSSAPPEWDVWAWYQPIHYFGADWGIYIRESALLECARRIARTASIPATGHHVMNLAKAMIRAAFSTLFLHEQYHHKTESLALRLHVVEQRPVYPNYHVNVYRATRGTKDQIEEGLANADSWFRVARSPYSTWTGATVNAATRLYLERSFAAAPPGYSNAAYLLSPADFDAEQRQLFAQVQEGITPRRATLGDFDVATHLNRSLFSVKQRIWTIVPSGARSILPTHPAVAPLETRSLQRYIKRAGWTEVPGGGKGSHRKFRGSDGKAIILPDRKDVPLPVLKSTAEALGVTVRRLEDLVGGAR